MMSNTIDTINATAIKSESNVRRAVEISTFSANLDPPKGLRKLGRASETFLVVIVDDQRLETHVGQRTRTPSWNDTFTLSIQGSSSLEIQVWELHTLLSKRMVGTFRGLINQLLDSQKTTELITKTLIATHATKSESQSTVTFRLALGTAQAPSQAALTADAVRRAKDDASLMDGPPKLLGVTGGIVTCTAAITDTAQSVEDAVMPLPQAVTLVDKLAKLAESFATIHPYAQAAWNILSAIYKVVKAQEARDSALRGLLQTMSEMLAFVEESEAITKIKALEGTVSLMAKQIEACAKFIRNYARTTSFFLRTLSNMLSDADSQVAAYKASFESLHRSFDSSVNLSTANLVTHIDQQLDEMDQKLFEMHTQVVLDKLVIAPASWNSDDQCQEGTRESVLDDIVRWVLTPPGDKAGNTPFLLTGVAGSGKSSVSNSIAERFSGLDMLGSTFFFDRADNKRNAPYRVISTMARDLAALDPLIAESIYTILKKDPSLADTTDVRRQFEHLLLGPAKKASTNHVVVLIVDALDECNERRPLLELLASQWHRLPKQFRLIMTARPQRDILRMIEDSVFRYALPSIGDDNTMRDISLFITQRLGIVAHRERIGEGWPSERDHDALVDMSSGLFIWIKTVCNFVDSSLSPRTTLRDILDNEGKLAGNIDELYITALESAHDWSDRVFSHAFQVLMGIVMAAKTPQSLEAIGVLAEPQKLDPSVSIAMLLRPLGCLLTGLDGEGNLVRTLHPSFHDFLTSPDRAPARFFIDKTKHNTELALSCFTLLNSKLKRNICGIADETMLNAEVPGLADLIRSHISQELQYAACFAVNHLVDVPTDNAPPALVSSLQEFLHYHLLEWLEVLSLMNSLDVIDTDLLQQVGRWLQKVDPNQTNSQILLYDMERFLLTFRGLLMRNALQAHSSALLFTPDHILLRKQYLSKQEPDRMVLNTQHTWSRLLSTMEGHTRYPTLAEFSPDGTRLVSCADDKTMRLWDAHRGVPIGDTLVGHTDEPRTIIFSPDGKRLVSCSYDKTIRFWDAHSGVAIGDPLVGHTGRIMDVIFSPDGTRLASCSDDKTVRLWDAHNGVPIGDPLIGHTDGVLRITFSPDGMRLASTSYSSDEGIRLWDVHSGVMIHGALIGARTPFEFSPDGTCIASSLNGKDIQLWDAHSGLAIGDALIGHTGSFGCIIFSPDGIRLASSSDDGTIRLWDAHSGVTIALVGRAPPYSAIKFSPDGMRLASYSDKTIRLWDAQSGVAICAPLDGHIKDIRDVQFSPDGRYLASYSDKIICLWDAQIGGAIDGTLLGHTESIQGIVFSRDGTRLASRAYDNTIRLWNVQLDAAVLVGQTDSVSHVIFSSDGTRFASYSDNTIHLWDAHSGVAIGDALVGHTDTIQNVMFSPDGTRLASCSKDNTIRLWDAHKGVAIRDALLGHTDSVQSVIFSPDGTRLATSSHDLTIRLWNAHTGDAIGDPLIGHIKFSWRIEFSLDGTRLASCSYDHTIRLWDAHSGAAISDAFIGHTDYVEPVIFSPDGSRIASYSPGDRTIRLWDAHSGAAIGDALVGNTGYVHRVIFSPDGTRLASCSEHFQVLFWDAQSGARIGDGLDIHTWGVRCIQFSPDGTRMASGSGDKTIRLWDAHSGATISDALVVHSEPRSVIFSPDGMLLASGSEDKVIRLWDAHSGRAILDMSTKVRPNSPDSWLAAAVPPFIRDDGWLMFGSSQMVWIPQQYRGNVTFVHGNVFAIIAPGGAVVLRLV